MEEKAPTVKFVGYRNLSTTEIDLVNETKLLAEEVAKHLRKVESLPSTDLRWINIATTDLQKGFMALTRSITKPTSF